MNWITPLNHFQNKKGFSLIEILVALTLGAGLYGLYQQSGNDNRKKLEESINNLERAIRFSLDEATLRNTIGHFVLPPQEAIVSNLSSSENDEKEKAKKVKSALDRKFSKVSDYSDRTLTIQWPIKLIGVGTTHSKVFITDSEASIYVFQTGEKDSGIIILGSEEELAVLALDPFTLDFKKSFHKMNISAPTIEEFEEKRIEMATQLFKEWDSSL
jgi:prepilin-type N-terminal cleavage/methylation domain-containing protein